jgi:hypothetical protein
MAFALAIAAGSLAAADLDAASCAQKVAALIDPVKLATLGERRANPRVQKYVAILAEARSAKIPPELVVTQAVALVKMKPLAAAMTSEAMLRNLRIAESLGCLDEAGLKDMHKGQSPTVRNGPYKGDQLSVDHIIPRAVVPELDNVIANLELMPLRMNEGKNAAVGDRQRALAGQLFKAGLLSEAGLKAALKTDTDQKAAKR